MIVTGHNPPAAPRERRDNPIFEGFRTDFILTGNGSRPRPQAFLVDQDAGFHLRTHFHLEHQFQVVVRGGGTLGRHALRPFACHYASPEAGYGPIDTGPEGLSYFTLRVMHDATTWLLPDERDRLRAGLKKRQRMAEAPRLGTPQELAARTEAHVEEMMPLDDKGIGAWFVRLPPAGSVVLPHADVGGGRFHIVAGGAMVAQDDCHGPVSVVFSSRDEDAFAITAAKEGLEVLVVQFPAEALQGYGE